MKQNRSRWMIVLLQIVVATIAGLISPLFAQVKKPAPFPWMNTGLSPAERANLVLKELSLDEKISLIHGEGMPGWGKTENPKAYLGNGGAGFVMGIPRLGIPFIQMSDAAYGVRSSAENGRYSTALPSNLGAAASWDTEAACQYGALIGRELRAQGYNMSLGGGVNLTREPRNGRTFEYEGEDPILAGTMVGNRIRCEQAEHVIGDIKHYVLNDQEDGRLEVNAVITKRAMQETDLLAFHIGIRTGNPAAVMCSYNAVNGDFACENKYLLTDVLKEDWAFPGFVFSDWGGTHSVVKASKAGLDNEEPEASFYGEPMKQAVLEGKVPTTELDEHVRRILRSEFAAGLVDFPLRKSVVDVEGGFAVSRRLAEQSIVLLKNSADLLPLDSTRLKSIAVIGSHADTGMISGGGSAQVDPPGAYKARWNTPTWFPTSPLVAIKSKAPDATIQFQSGDDVAKAAALARQSDVAIVFVHQWTREEMDLTTLSLPDGQDELIERVAAENPRTIVVLETGTVVTMPWVEHVSGILESWYSGSKGADAVANVLFGEVNPSAKLPLTFPISEKDLPRPHLIAPPPGAQTIAASIRTDPARPTFQVAYDEGLKVGYKWYDAEQKPVLFPFGFGLSYTSYGYSELAVTADSATIGKPVAVRFTVKNTGKRAGTEIAQVYASLPDYTGEPPQRLIGWSRIPLNAGESKIVTVLVAPEYLSVFDDTSDKWKLPSGTYTIRVGKSSRDPILSQKITIP